MKYKKTLLVVPVVAVALVVGFGTRAATVDLFTSTLNDQTIFANTYVTVGAHSSDQKVNGNILANQAVTTGAGSVISGDIESGAAVTLGANSHVSGTVGYSAAVTNGAGSSSGVQTQNTTSSGVIDEHQGVIDAQSALDGMSAGTTLDSMTEDIVLSSGVYNVPGYLTTAADVTITLDAENQDGAFIFNISTYLSFGAGTVVEVINGTPNTTVIWNVTDGYASMGANAEIVGAILAEQYVVVGAGSTITGSGNSCGGIFSGLSYVTIGADVLIGTSDCAEGAINNMNITDDVAHYEVVHEGDPGGWVPPSAF